MPDAPQRPPAPDAGPTGAALRGLRETDRLEAFSDAVIAIVATLLVTDLKLPETATGPAGAWLWQGLGTIAPALAAFVVSFITVVVFWANHHQAFRHIRYTDPGLVVLNGLVLLVIAFIPFPTAVLAANVMVPGRAAAATILYASALLAVSASFNLMWAYVVRHPDLLEAPLDPRAVRFHTTQYRLGLAMRAGSVLLAFVSVPWCLAVLPLISLYYLVPRG